eukprot:GILI01017237.1.p1 GENE.GILI01017237.1~~GILI01017237.1.p1  ORF type:complete len:281 (+),score=29.83 GILI01017237.1:101-943(+)
MVSSAFDDGDDVPLTDIFGEDSDDEDKRRNEYVYVTKEGKSFLSKLPRSLEIPNSLFAGDVWMGARCIMSYLERNPHILHNSRILELGAAAALPSLLSLHLGAKKVVSSDYPNKSLLECVLSNLQGNFPDLVCPAVIEPESSCLPSSPSDELLQSPSSHRAFAVGYKWGGDPFQLLQCNDGLRFDVVIMAEVLWIHQEHSNLVKTLSLVLKPGGIALVSFCHHIPGLEAQDLAFFELAKEAQFSVEFIETQQQKHVFRDCSVPVYLYAVRALPRPADCPQ